MWQETLLTEADVLELCDEYPLLDFTCTDDYRQEFEAIKRKQAEKTWHSRDKEVEEAEQRGIRKVVEWINDHPVYLQSNTLGIKVPIQTEPIWDAFLKEISPS